MPLAIGILPTPCFYLLRPTAQSASHSQASRSLSEGEALVLPARTFTFEAGGPEVSIKPALNDGEEVLLVGPPMGYNAPVQPADGPARGPWSPAPREGLRLQGRRRPTAPTCAWPPPHVAQSRCC